MNRFVIAACAASLLAFAACSESSPTSKSQSGVEIRPGNVNSCAALGLAGLKIDPVAQGASGPYTAGALTVNIVVSGKSFSFTSNIPVDLVGVKGGPNTAIYEYDPEVMSGSGLTTENGAYGLSHIIFCYDAEHPDTGAPDTAQPPDTQVPDSGSPPDTQMPDSGSPPDTNQPPPDTTPPCNPEEDPEC